MSPDAYSPDAYSDEFLRGILDGTRTIAIVGASPDWNRPSYFAMKYLQGKGYRVIPVNPKAAGQDILGERCYASLAEVPVPVDLVDVFRNAAAVPGVLDEVLAMSPRPRVFWMQLGVRNEAAAEAAEQAGLDVVMNRCPKLEWARLHGELSWSGVASRTISSKRRKLSDGR